MNFGAIQNMVLADAFAEGKRANAKVWINSAYQTIWDSEEWSFRTASVNANAVGGQQALSGMPADFGNAIYLLNADGDPLRPIQDVRQFYALFVDEERSDPEAFTVVGSSSIILGPIPDVDETMTLLYQRSLTELSADQDIPAIPSGYHMAIVLGARMQGCALLKIPVFEAEQREYERLLAAMRLNYLSPVRGEHEQVGAYRAGF